MHCLRILAINPGSTSTKIAVFANEQPLFQAVVSHQADELKSFARVTEQYEYRLGLVKAALLENDILPSALDAVVGRGGALGPIPGGTYLVDDDLLQGLYNSNVEHASNLGGIMAYNLAQELGIPAFIVDPVSVDEMIPEAKLSGLPQIPRWSLGHALNMKAVARKAAAEMGKKYHELNLIVAHLGSGVSVTPHLRGKMVDVNNANNEGPFSPERAGGVPAGGLVKLCYSGKYTEQEMIDLLTKSGGIYAYLGTKDSRVVEERAQNGDAEAALVLKAFVHQVAKEIGAMAAVLDGKVDRILITGGMAHSQFITTEINKKVSFIAPVMVFPGEEELEALALGALRVLRQEEKPARYGDVRR
ncbi:MAG TPA: butyrate kinase [Verrucomicrobiae bacterium]|nr:butyrate kinase [Verrucomicrobiae bacterium]